MNDLSGQGGQFLYNLLLFGRVCKALGMEVSPYRMTEVARALNMIDLREREEVYHTMRALIVTRQRDLELFDEAFALFWRRPTEGWTQLDFPSTGKPQVQHRPQFVPPPSRPAENDDRALSPSVLTALVPTYSQQETLRHKDFAELTSEELAQINQAIQRLPKSLSNRRVRRTQPGKGQQPDLRRAFRRSLRYAGELMELPTTIRKIKPRPLVLICDISGSMERYTRVFLQFMHVFATAMTRVESFVFSVQLTRITPHLRYKSVDRALQEVGDTVKDWSGGTKIGQALHTFNYQWSRRTLGHGAIVLLITDGWDRGEPDLLRHETAHLQRSCSRLIWLNPLLGVPGYEPLTRGAQAILPFADDFLPLRNLSNLEAILAELQKLRGNRLNKPGDRLNYGLSNVRHH